MEGEGKAPIIIIIIIFQLQSSFSKAVICVLMELAKKLYVSSLGRSDDRGAKTYLLSYLNCTEKSVLQIKTMGHQDKLGTAFSIASYC